MLPPAPPVPSDTDFDPSTMTADDVDLEMQLDEDDIKVELSSVEINLLIYLVCPSLYHVSHWPNQLISSPLVPARIQFLSYGIRLTLRIKPRCNFPLSTFPSVFSYPIFGVFSGWQYFQSQWDFWTE